MDWDRYKNWLIVSNRMPILAMVAAIHVRLPLLFNNIPSKTSKESPTIMYPE